LSRIESKYINDLSLRSEARSITGIGRFRRPHHITFWPLLYLLILGYQLLKLFRALSRMRQWDSTSWHLWICKIT
jgi:hypothetical protein